MVDERIDEEDREADEPRAHEAASDGAAAAATPRAAGRRRRSAAGAGAAAAPGRRRDAHGTPPAAARAASAARRSACRPPGVRPAGRRPCPPGTWRRSLEQSPGWRARGGDRRRRRLRVLEDLDERLELRVELQLRRLRASSSSSARCARPLEKLTSAWLLVVRYLTSSQACGLVLAVLRDADDGAGHVAGAVELRLAVGRPASAPCRS